jgi:hypothetical protein
VGGYKRRHYTDRNGKEHVVLGAEPIALNFIENVALGCQVFTRNLPKIPYQIEGSNHSYHPDIGVMHKGKRTIVEVKSGFTLGLDADKNAAKFRAARKFCKRRGWTFKLMVVSKTKVTVLTNPRKSDWLPLTKPSTMNHTLQ